MLGADFSELEHRMAAVCGLSIKVPHPKPPEDPERRKRYDRGRKLFELGQVVPVPWLRPWLRRRGHALVCANEDVEIHEVQLGDWAHHSVYATIDLNTEGPATSATSRIRRFLLQKRTRAVSRFWERIDDPALEERYRYETYWNAFWLWLEDRGVW